MGRRRAASRDDSPPGTACRLRISGSVAAAGSIEGTAGVVAIAG
jgi:hypothetical protein